MCMQIYTSEYSFVIKCLPLFQRFDNLTDMTGHVGSYACVLVYACECLPVYECICTTVRAGEPMCLCVAGVCVNLRE